MTGESHALSCHYEGDRKVHPASGNAKVRIGHLAPFAAGASNTLADVRLQDGTILPGFDDVPYGVIADYIPLPADVYDLKVTSADGSITLIDPLPFTLNDGDILSVFAVGDGANQPVGIFALSSGAPGALLPLEEGSDKILIFGTVQKPLLIVQ